MRLVLLLSILAVGGAGCSDTTLYVNHYAPEVSIVNTGGSTLVGAPIELAGKVSDDGPTGDLEVIWGWTSADVPGASGDEPGAPPDENQDVWWTFTPTYEGPLTITLRVIDGDGMSSEAKVNYMVGIDAQPTATIYRPDLDSTLYETGVELVGVALDDTTPASQLQVVWTSDGVDLGLPVTPADNGETTGIVAIEAGLHTLALTVTDGAGQTGRDEMLVEVLPCFLDVDGDGHFTDACPGGDDCDDSEASVYVGAPEICDDLDNDCDGTVDEVGVTWYFDADGDLYGDPAVTLVQCDHPEDYVTNGDDCDDTDPRVNPGAEESDCTDPTDYNCDGSVAWEDYDGDGYAACEDCDDADAGVNPAATESCDGVDNDCDGTVDEPDAAGAATWYLDADGDGYGDLAATTTACAAPSGYVALGTDCDDGDATIHPGATEDCSDPVDRNCDGSVTFSDADGDGSPACLDCDDADATAYPGATEVCDGVDNDCDGAVDEGAIDAVTLFRDADGDGYGDPAFSMAGCSGHSGWVADATDCDDVDPTAHPGAVEACNGDDDDCDGLIDEDWGDSDGDGILDCADVETCDGLDNDGDGVVDEGFGDADGDGVADCVDTEVCDGLDNDGDGDVDEGLPIGATAWYLDADGDGYGAGAAFTACAAPAGYVADGTDCDDGDATVYPGATEACDGLDTDCDGVVPSDEVDADGDGAYACGDEGDCDDSDPTVYPGAPELCDGKDNNCNGEYPFGGEDDDDADGYAACNCDYFDDLALCEAASDCNDLDPEVHPGAAEECNEVDDNCNGVVDDGYTDSDGDGFVCTDCDDGDPTSYPGGIEVWDGADNDCDGVVDNQIDHDLADFCVRGEEIGDMALGTFFGSRSDFNGDGLADLLVAAPLYDPSASTTDAGFIGVFFGAAGGFAGGVAEATLLDADSVILGDTYNQSVWPMSIGDLDGDGTDDLIVSETGAWGADDIVFLFSGLDEYTTLGMSEAVDSFRTSSRLLWDRGHFGGDWDGDNIPDIVSPEVVFGEHVYVIDGERLGSLGGEYASTIADLSVWIDGAYYYGSPVSLEEDLGGSGFDDLAVACTACDEGGGTMSGAVYVFRSGGAWPGDLDQDDAITVLYAATAGDRLGWDLTSPGDIDGDGAADLLVQARDANDGDGVLYVIPGPIPTGTYEVSSVALAIETEVTSNCAFGYAPTAADLEGDGLLDLLTVRTTSDGTAFFFGGDALALSEGTSIVAEDEAAATFDIDTMPDNYGAAIGPDADGDGTAEIVLYGYGEMGSGYSTSESEACVFYGRNGP